MRIELLFGALLGFAVALPPVLRNSTTAVAENLKRNLSAINDLDYQNSNRLKRIVIGSRRREEEVNEPALPAPDRNRVAAQVAAQQSQSKNGEVKSASPLPDDDYDYVHNGEDYGKPQLHLQDSVFFDPRVDPFVMERVDWSESSHKDEKKEEIGQKAAGKTAESQRKKRQSGENKQIDASGLGQDSTISKPEIPVITGSTNASLELLKSKISNVTRQWPTEDIAGSSNTTTESQSQAANKTIPQGTGCSASATVLLAPPKSDDVRRNRRDSDEDEETPKVISNAIGQQANCSASITVVMMQSNGAPQPAAETQERPPALADEQQPRGYQDIFRESFPFSVVKNATKSHSKPNEEKKKVPIGNSGASSSHH